MTRRPKGTRIDPLEALAVLESAISGGATGRRAVLAKYARKAKNGEIVRCAPSPMEYTAAGRSSGGKPIYDTEQAARAAAAELVRMGARPMEPYPCQRSKHGHVHLRTIRPGLHGASNP